MTSKKYRSVIATIIAAGLMWAMSEDLTYDSILSALCGSSDIETCDFYNRVFNGASDKKVDENIIIVNIDTVFERKDLALLIRSIDRLSPKAIAVDAIFEERKDSVGDLFLINTLKEIRNLLMAQALNPYTMKPEQDLISVELPDISRGIINLTERKEEGIIRSFTPFFGEQKEYSAFPCAIANIIDKKCVSRIHERGREDEYIYFSPNEFYILEPSDIEKDVTMIRDKIVMLGTINDPLDLHRTPVSVRYPGVMLHAQATSMLIHGQLLKEFSDILNWILAIASCLFMTYIYVATDKSGVHDLGARVMPIVWMFAVIWIGCYAFAHWHIYLDASEIVLLSALAILVLDFWYAFEAFVVYIKNKSNKNE